MMTIHDELQIKHELHTGQRFTEGAATYRYADCSECNGTGGGRFQGPGECDGCDGVKYRSDMTPCCVECEAEHGKPHAQDCDSRIARAIASGTHAATRAGR